MNTRLLLVYPADPLGQKIGGIETFIKGLIVHTPPDIDIDFIGISSDRINRPPRRWLKLKIKDREFRFFPIFYEKEENRKKFVPLSLRFSLAVRFYRINTGEAVILHDNIESVVSSTQKDNPRIAVIHHDAQQQIMRQKGETLWSRMPWIYAIFEKKAFSILDYIYTVGADAFETYKLQYPGYSDKFLRISIWADDETFYSSDKSKHSLRQGILSLNNPIPIESKWILFAGRLQKVKAPFRLVDAFLEYNKGPKDACLIILGDGDMKSDLHKYIEKKDAKNSIFLPGEVSPGTLADFYRASDVFLLTSDSETGPRCVLEALSCGLPAVSTNVGEAREFIKNGFSGEVVESFSAPDIAKALEKVLSNPQIYKKENCVNSAREYTPQKVLAPVYGMIRKLYNDKYNCIRKVSLCGVDIDNISMQEAIERVDLLVKKRQPSYVVTPNIDHIVKLDKDAEFREAYKNASLVLADGMPLIWASKFLGHPLKGKVSGSDLFPKICGMAAAKRYRLFFMGGRPGAAQKSAEVLKNIYPDINIVGIYAPPYGFEGDREENEKIVKMIKESNPDILFVGLGAPKQETWIYKYREHYQSPVSIGIGASFEFIAGMVKRAPLWMQRIGLEWFWRLMMEPGRLWKRYLIDDMRFFWLVLKQRLGLG